MRCECARGFVRGEGRVRGAIVASPKSAVQEGQEGLVPSGMQELGQAKKN